MDSKGIGVGQVFVFMIAAITFSMIMIFGYRMIHSFLADAETVEFVKFKTDLVSSIQKIYTEYGAVRVKQFRVSGKYEKICFVNMNAKPSDEEMKKLCDADALACSVWQDAQESGKGDEGVEQNVFLTPTALTPIKVFRITVRDADDAPQNFVCTKIKKGTFTLTLEGKGDHTEISLAQAQEE